MPVSTDNAFLKLASSDDPPGQDAQRVRQRRRRKKHAEPAKLLEEAQSSQTTATSLPALEETCAAPVAAEPTRPALLQQGVVRSSLPEPESSSGTRGQAGSANTSYNPGRPAEAAAPSPHLNGHSKGGSTSPQRSPSPTKVTAALLARGSRLRERHDSERSASSAQQAAQPTAPQGWRGLWAYLAAEYDPGGSGSGGSGVGTRERQRVYNSMLSVPYQLEQLICLGLAIALDSFLAIFTVLPVRLGRAAARLLWHPPWGSPWGSPSSSSFPRSSSSPPGGSSSASASASSVRISVSGSAVYDCIFAGVFGAALAFLRALPAGALYFWLKDLTQEFLKLHVVHSAVEICDKIAGSFAADCLEALYGDCQRLQDSAGPRWDSIKTVALNMNTDVQSLSAAKAVALDTGALLLLALLHAGTLAAHSMVFAVAMHSKRGHATLALLIASTFVEIKGTVFKKFDLARLFALVCQDVTERFHLALCLAFVVAEDMDNASLAWPNPDLVRPCLYIFGAEILIDLCKHAVLCKFNDVKPGVYRHFMREVCERAQGSQSQGSHRLVHFEPLAPAAFAVRIALTLAATGARLAGEQRASLGRRAATGAALLAVWVCGVILKAGLGFGVRCFAGLFLARTRHRRQQ